MLLNRQLRSNVRNLLAGANLQEAQDFVASAIARGDTEAVDYAEEFIRDYASDFGQSNDDTGELLCRDNPSTRL